MIIKMFKDILAVFITSFKISISLKDFTSFKMDKDEEEIKKHWNNYLNSEYCADDFFVDTPEELIENQQAYANPTCFDCSRETYSLLTEGDNNIISMCPGCRRIYKAHI